MRIPDSEAADIMENLEIAVRTIRPTLTRLPSGSTKTSLSYATNDIHKALNTLRKYEAK